jgi:hypothetical protein
MTPPSHGQVFGREQSGVISGPTVSQGLGISIEATCEDDQHNRRPARLNSSMQVCSRLLSESFLNGVQALV